MKHNNTWHSLVVDVPHGFNGDVKEVICKAFQDYLYFGICHDHDVNDDGLLKTKHYHVVVYSDKRIKTDTMMSELKEHCSLMNDECISDRVVGSEAKAVQYLTHKNDRDKYQYSFDDIFTNSRDSLIKLYNFKAVAEIGDTAFIDLVLNAKSKKDVISIIGVENFNKYQKTIMFLWDERYKYASK